MGPFLDQLGQRVWVGSQLAIGGVGGALGWGSFGGGAEELALGIKGGEVGVGGEGDAKGDSGPGGTEDGFTSGAGIAEGKGSVAVGGASEGMDLEDEAVGGTDEVLEGGLIQPTGEGGDDQGHRAGDGAQGMDPLLVSGQLSIGGIEVQLEFSDGRPVGLGGGQEMGDFLKEHTGGGCGGEEGSLVGGDADGESHRLPEGGQARGIPGDVDLAGG